MQCNHRLDGFKMAACGIIFEDTVVLSLVLLSTGSFTQKPAG
jgi:hypothetical protein